MSKVNEEVNEVSKEVIETPQGEVTIVEKKKFNLKSVAKKAAIGLGVLTVGALGFVLGKSSGKRNNDYEDVESYEVNDNNE